MIADFFPSVGPFPCQVRPKIQTNQLLHMPCFSSILSGGFRILWNMGKSGTEKEVPSGTPGDTDV